jgi:WhiB family redox-sensing transcriptional regulator
MQDLAYMDRLFLPDRDTEWQDQARCKNADPDLFYPDPPEATGKAAAAAYRARVETATTYCEFCPVKAECLTDAKDRGEQNGIWGGQDFYIPRRKHVATKEAS